MNPEQFNTADFQDILRASYLPQRKAEELMASKGYGYDKELSTMAHKVFISPSGQPVISNRGSVTAKDWLYEDTNAALGGIFGKTEKVKATQQLSKETQNKYGVAPTYASHSLGAYLSEQGAKATPKSEVFSYNKAAGIPSVFYSTPKTHHDFRTSLDLPSALSSYQGGGSHTTLKGSWNPLASHDLKYLKI